MRGVICYTVSQISLLAYGLVRKPCIIPNLVPDSIDLFRLMMLMTRGVVTFAADVALQTWRQQQLPFVAP